MKPLNFLINIPINRLAVISPSKVIVLAKDQQNMGIIESITLDHSKKGTYIHIKSNILFASQLTHDDQ